LGELRSPNDEQRFNASRLLALLAPKVSEGLTHSLVSDLSGMLLDGTKGMVSQWYHRQGVIATLFSLGQCVATHPNLKASCSGATLSTAISLALAACKKEPHKETLDMALSTLGTWLALANTYVPFPFKSEPYSTFPLLLPLRLFVGIFPMS
jgi:hypothetical protein